LGESFPIGQVRKHLKFVELVLHGFAPTALVITQEHLVITVC
jgi:hypothetical protein